MRYDTDPRNGTARRDDPEPDELAETAEDTSATDDQLDDRQPTDQPDETPTDQYEGGQPTDQIETREPAVDDEDRVATDPDRDADADADIDADDDGRPDTTETVDDETRADDTVATDSDARTDADLTTDADADARTDADLTTDADADARTDLATDSDVHTDADTDLTTNADVHTDADTDPTTDSDARADADTDRERRADDAWAMAVPDPAGSILGAPVPGALGGIYPATVGAPVAPVDDERDRRRDDDVDTTSGAEATTDDTEVVDDAAIADAEPVVAADSTDDVGDATPAEMMPGDVESTPIGSLWSPEVAEDLRERWRGVQLRFVDDPRAATDEADGLIGEAVESFVRALEFQRQELASWRNDASDTERLRVAVQRYRDFFENVLNR